MSQHIITQESLLYIQYCGIDNTDTQTENAHQINNELDDSLHDMRHIHSMDGIQLETISEKDSTAKKDNVFKCYSPY